MIIEAINIDRLWRIEIIAKFVMWSNTNLAEFLLKNQKGQVYTTISYTNAIKKITAETF